MPLPVSKKRRTYNWTTVQTSNLRKGVATYRLTVTPCTSAHHLDVQFPSPLRRTHRRAKVSHGSEREVPDRSAPVGRNPLPSPPPSTSVLCLTFHPHFLSPALILPLSTSRLLFLNHLSSLPFFLHSTPYLHASGTAQGWRAASGAHTLP